MPGRVADVVFWHMAVVLFRLAESVWAIRNLLVDSLVCIVIVWLTGPLELLIPWRQWNRLVISLVCIAIVWLTRLLELLNLLEAAESAW